MFVFSSALRAPRTQRVLFMLFSIFLLVASTGCQSMICVLDPDEEHLCEAPVDLATESITVSEPIVYSSGVAFRVPEADRITLLKTQGADAEIEHISVPEDPYLMVATPDQDRLLIVSRETRTLTALDPVTKAQVRYDLGSPFDRLDVSEDGSYAIAYYSSNFEENVIVRNTNEMAIVRLREDPAPDDVEGQPNPQNITLRSFGSRPQGISFAPSFTINGQERRVALVLAANYVTLLELDGFDPEEPNRNETVVRFVRDDDNRSLVPRKIVWTEDKDQTRDDDMFAFLLVSGSDDIISLNLLPGEEIDAVGRPRVRPSLNQLTGGRSPLDLSLFETTRGERKLVTINAQSRDMSIIDVSTSDTVQVPLEASITSALVYQGINRETGNEEPFALLYNGSGSSRTVYFAELNSVEVRGTRALRQLNLDSAIERLVQTPQLSRTLLLHPGRRTFSILNLDRRAVAPLEVIAPIADYAFAGVGDERLVTVFENQPYVGFTDLDNAHPTPIRLDIDAVRAVTVPGTDTLLVDHGREGGVVTLMSLSAPGRTSAKMYWGIGLDGILDEANGE